MTNNSMLPRRGFLRVVSTSSAALTATGLLDACAATSSASGAPRPAQAASTTWDMSWLDRVTAPYRVVFNVTQVSSAEMAMSQATSWLDGHAQAHGVSDSDLNLVMVFRHEAVRVAISESDARAQIRAAVSAGVS